MQLSAMKSAFLIPTFTAATLFLSVARADDAVTPDTTNSRRHAHKQELLQKYDQNGDGKLDESERAAAREAFQARIQEFRTRFDVNNDGKIDAQERAAVPAETREKVRAMQQRRHAAGAAHRPAPEAIIERFDQDADGKLNRDELTAMMGARHERLKKVATEIRERRAKRRGATPAAETPNG